MAKVRRPKSRKGSHDGFRQAAIVVGIGVVLTGGLLAGGDYVLKQQYRPATIKAFVKSVPQAGTKVGLGNGDEVYTGSILYFPYEGNNCRQILFDNRNGRLTDNGYVDCGSAEQQSGINSAKQWSAARVKVISDGFRDR